MSGFSFSRSWTSNKPPFRNGTFPSRSASSGSLSDWGFPRPSVEQFQQEYMVEVLEFPDPAFVLTSPSLLRR